MMHGQAFYFNASCSGATMTADTPFQRCYLRIMNCKYSRSVTKRRTFVSSRQMRGDAQHDTPGIKVCSFDVDRPGVLFWALRNSATSQNARSCQFQLASSVARISLTELGVSRIALPDRVDKLHYVWSYLAACNSSWSYYAYGHALRNFIGCAVTISEATVRCTQRCAPEKLWQTL